MGNGHKTDGMDGPDLGGFITGAMVGALIAGVLALLYAPRSGKETRDGLKVELQDTQNMFQCWSEDLKTRIESFYRVISASINNASINNKEAQPMGDGRRPPE